MNHGPSVNNSKCIHHFWRHGPHLSSGNTPHASCIIKCYLLKVYTNGSWEYLERFIFRRSEERLNHRTGTYSPMALPTPAVKYYATRKINGNLNRTQHNSYDFPNQMPGTWHSKNPGMEGIPNN